MWLKAEDVGCALGEGILILHDDTDGEVAHEGPAGVGGGGHAWL